MLEKTKGLKHTLIMSWQTTVTDPDEVKVFQALDTDKGNWRTMWGIARQTGLSEDRVEDILAKYNLRLTRLAEVPSISGSPLVGLIEKVGT
jgi:hypothetical protein